MRKSGMVFGRVRMRVRKRASLLPVERSLDVERTKRSNTTREEDIQTADGRSRECGHSCDGEVGLEWEATLVSNTDNGIEQKTYAVGVDGVCSEGAGESVQNSILRCCCCHIASGMSSSSLTCLAGTA